MVERAGIDQGGLLKELLESILHQGFDADFGLIQFTADGRAFPSPLAHRVPGGLGMLEFLGLAVAKALYEGLLLDIELASLFIMALQRRHPALEDLYTLDADLYRSLIQVRIRSRAAAHTAAPRALSCQLSTCVRVPVNRAAPGPARSAHSTPAHHLLSQRASHLRVAPLVWPVPPEGVEDPCVRERGSPGLSA